MACAETQAPTRARPRLDAVPCADECSPDSSSSVTISAAPTDPSFCGIDPNNLEFSAYVVVTLSGCGGGRWEFHYNPAYTGGDYNISAAFVICEGSGAVTVSGPFLSDVYSQSINGGPRPIAYHSVSPNCGAPYKIVTYTGLNCGSPIAGTCWDQVNAAPALLHKEVRICDGVTDCSDSCDEDYGPWDPSVCTSAPDTISGTANLVSLATDGVGTPITTIETSAERVCLVGPLSREIGSFGGLAQLTIVGVPASPCAPTQLLGSTALWATSYSVPQVDGYQPFIGTLIGGAGSISISTG